MTSGRPSFRLKTSSVRRKPSALAVADEREDEARELRALGVEQPVRGEVDDAVTLAGRARRRSPRSLRGRARGRPSSPRRARPRRPARPPRASPRDARASAPRPTCPRRSSRPARRSGASGRAPPLRPGPRRSRPFACCRSRARGSAGSKTGSAMSRIEFAAAAAAVCACWRTAAMTDAEGV